jgi:hypothetical protein
MATNTTNYSYNLPAVNDPVDANIWGDLLNENWEAADEDIFVASRNQVLVKSADYTVTSDDLNKVILVDASAGNRTITLPTATSVGDGFNVYVKLVSSSGKVFIDSADTIDGVSAAHELTNEEDAVKIVSGASVKWHIVSRKIVTATTSRTGTVELATDTETQTGTATDKVLTPSNIPYQLFPVALVAFDTNLNDSDAAISVNDNCKIYFSENVASVKFITDPRYKFQINLTGVALDISQGFTIQGTGEALSISRGGGFVSVDTSATHTSTMLQIKYVAASSDITPADSTPNNVSKGRIDVAIWGVLDLS